MSSVTGVTTVEYKFDIEDIKDKFGQDLSPVRIQEIAHTLAANLEHPSLFDLHGNVRITRGNFNDSYDDMVDDLIEVPGDNIH